MIKENKPFSCLLYVGFNSSHLSFLCQSCQLFKASDGESHQLLSLVLPRSQHPVSRGKKPCLQRFLFDRKSSVKKWAQGTKHASSTGKPTQPTHADSKRSTHFSLQPPLTLVFTQHSSANTHKHIRTHFYTYPQMDSNKRTRKPDSNRLPRQEQCGE